jgi:proteasome lid subunit RPN8/RPN11
MTSEQGLRILLAPLPPSVEVPPRAHAPTVHVAAEVLKQVEGHARANLHCEVGGLLLGKARLAGSGMQIEITGALAAETSEASPVHVTFTHESWRGLRHRRTEHPGALVVGWYHTHPDLDVFLSGTDRILHRQIFAAQPWCVALVLDPVRRRRAFFWPYAAEVAQCPETIVPLRPPRPDEAAGGPRHGVPEAQGPQ